MKSRELLERLRAEGRCGCGRPRFRTKGGRLLSRCAYCLDTTAWLNRINQFDIPLSAAGPRPKPEDYADGLRHLPDLPYRHNGPTITT